MRLETRGANVEGEGAVEISDLIRASLRMRPNYLIVGEVRGKECLDMLQALNTGHFGLSTGHGNSAGDMLSRLETMALYGCRHSAGRRAGTDCPRLLIYWCIWEGCGTGAGGCWKSRKYWGTLMEKSD